MRSFQNQGGGTTVELTSADQLDAVPASHLDMLSEDLRAAFANPSSYLVEASKRCKIQAMKNWLVALATDGNWRLLLHEGGFYERTTLAAFYWQGRTVVSAMISLPPKSLSPRMPEGFRHYYSLVDVVHWDSFGCAGGLLGSQQHIPFATFHGPRPKRKGFDPKKCVVWGNSASGDMLIHNDDGKSAICSHENGKVQLLGSIEEALDWVFQQLLDNKAPEFDYAKA
jgi:hypothetical protein